MLGFRGEHRAENEARRLADIERERGTTNRHTLDVIARLEALNCDPIAGMAKIAADEGAPIEVWARMFAELAGYVAPKRKAVDLALTDSRPVVISMTPTELDL